MAFRTEEILEEFAEVSEGPYGNVERILEAGFAVFTRSVRPTAAPDPADFKARRSVINKRWYDAHRKRDRLRLPGTPVERHRLRNKRHYARLKADPIRFAALRERQRKFEARKRLEKGCTVKVATHRIILEVNEGLLRRIEALAGRRGRRVDEIIKVSLIAGIMEMES